MRRGLLVVRRRKWGGCLLREGAEVLQWTRIKMVDDREVAAALAFEVVPMTEQAARPSVAYQSVSYDNVVLTRGPQSGLLSCTVLTG